MLLNTEHYLVAFYNKLSAAAGVFLLTPDLHGAIQFIYGSITDPDLHGAIQFRYGSITDPCRSGCQKNRPVAATK